MIPVVNFKFKQTIDTTYILQLSWVKPYLG